MKFDLDYSHEAMGYGVGGIFGYGLGIILSSAFTATSIQSKYNYVGIGTEIGKLISNIICLIDYIGRLGIVEVKKPWNRYGPFDIGLHKI